MKGQLGSILENEERIARMKSKVAWAKHGDGNTSLFHSLLSARKAKNSIWKLEKVDETITVNEAEIVEEINSFFEILYRSNPSTREEWNDILWQPMDPNNAENLSRPFDEEEIRRAVLVVRGINHRDRTVSPWRFSRISRRSSRPRCFNSSVTFGNRA